MCIKKKIHRHFSAQNGTNYIKTQPLLGLIRDTEKAHLRGGKALEKQAAKHLRFSPQ